MTDGHAKAAPNAISHASDGHKFRSLTMACVATLWENRHSARKVPCGERNVYGSFLVRKKGKQKYTYTYMLIFVQNKYGGDKLESNENCECFSKSCKRKCKTEGNLKCAKCSLYAEPSAGDCFCKALSTDSATIHTLGRSSCGKKAVPARSGTPSM